MAATQPILVLTNDDGYGHEGLGSLVQAATGLGQIRVVAPAEGQSHGSHAVTTGKDIPISVPDVDRWAVGGTPADCVRVALHRLAPDALWVLSGINAGGNLGTDVFHSGTVAAAREAALRGCKAIAISHLIGKNRKIDWNRASVWTRTVLERLMPIGCEPGTFWNVNLPHPGPEAPHPEILACPLDPSPLPLDFHFEGDRARYRGSYYQRPRVPDRDVAACFAGFITVSRVRLIDHADFFALPAPSPPS